MNITFILGNGFDIQLGLQSRYSDFLREYVKITPNDNDNIREFKTYLEQDATRELWSDAEIAMGKHLGQYSDATIEAFNERVQDFESCLIEYLQQQQDRCVYSDSNEIATRFISFLLESFDDVLTSRRSDLDVNARGENNTYQFISFNYTDLLEGIRQCCISTHNGTVIGLRRTVGGPYQDRLGSVFHVHGMLSNQIIMGVNDESQLDLSGGVTYTEALGWALIKPILNHDSGNNFDLPAKKAILGSDIIAIYGVSYGDTDKLWWKEIIKWLRKDSKHKLVAFIRDKRGRFNPALAWTELTYTKSKQREILKKLRVEENASDFENLTDQIYIVLNTERLNLKEVLVPEDSDDDDAVAASVQWEKPDTI